jgi:hypothetical protein
MKKKSTNAKINVRGTEVTVIRRKDENYISLTDMLKAKDGDFFISDWLRNRNTVEFLGIWETVHNPDFNSGEFAIIKSQTAREWRDSNPGEDGNMRDHATLEQLLVLANLEKEI